MSFAVEVDASSSNNSSGSEDLDDQQEQQPTVTSTPVAENASRHPGHTAAAAAAGTHSSSSSSPIGELDLDTDEDDDDDDDDDDEEEQGHRQEEEEEATGQRGDEEEEQRDDTESAADFKEAAAAVAAAAATGNDSDTSDEEEGGRGGGDDKEKTGATSGEASVEAESQEQEQKEEEQEQEDLNGEEEEERHEAEGAEDVEQFDSLDTLSSSMGSSSRREHLYKILVIGELGTGKTSIIRRYVHQFFSQHYRATIGVDFALKVLHWDQNTLIRLQLWDIAGQERFGNMTRVYYKEAVGCFIVFDVSRAATFEAVMKWKNDVDSKLQLPDGSPVPCVLLANKCDLQKEGLVSDGVKMDEFCKEKGFIGWFETSAKENIGVDEAAQFLVSKILANDIWSNLEPDSPDRIALEPSASGNKAPSKCSC